MKQIELMDYPSANTYVEGRKCKHCAHPIADQESKTREFCRKRVFSNGITIDCKDKYWSPQKRIEAQIAKEAAIANALLKEDLIGLEYLNNIQISWNSFAELGLQLTHAQKNYQAVEGTVFIYKLGYIIINRQTYSVTFKFN